MAGFGLSCSQWAVYVSQLFEPAMHFFVCYLKTFQRRSAVRLQWCSYGNMFSSVSKQAIGLQPGIRSSLPTVAKRLEALDAGNQMRLYLISLARSISTPMQFVTWYRVRGKGAERGPSFSNHKSVCRPPCHLLLYGSEKPVVGQTTRPEEKLGAEWALKKNASATSLRFP